MKNWKRQIVATAAAVLLGLGLVGCGAAKSETTAGSSAESSAPESAGESTAAESAAESKAEAEAGRISMIDTYKHDLMQSRTDKDIAMIPVEFTIERTTYSTTEAEVTVIEWFDYTSFREKKRFTYNLASRDDIWTVYDYSVDNLGTE